MSTNFGSNRAKRAESAWRDRDDVANRNQRETGNSHQQKRLKKKKNTQYGKTIPQNAQNFSRVLDLLHANRTGN